MCGIAGYFQSSTNNHNPLLKMLDTMKNRGPDEQSIYSHKNLFMGSRRLAINDLVSGSQPFYNDKKDIVMCYNGEIYNYKELKKKLENKGYNFTSRCDGEVICNLFKEYGTEAFHHLEGMFAITLWSTKTNTLYLARDFVGEKPLYYSKLKNNGLVFGSNIKSIDLFFKKKLDLNYQGIWDFPTFLWIPEPNTIFKNILCLPKASFLKINSSKFEIKKYKIKNYFFNDSDSTEKKILSLKEIVKSSVQEKLLSDVPVGTFLSSGIDSSIITALASRQIKNLETFSVGFEKIKDPFHGMADESELASEFAKFLGVKNYRIRLDENNVLNSLDIFSDNSDGPFGVSSGIGVLLIAKKAKELGVKVLLSGDGADEYFGGYSWYSFLNNMDFNDKSENETFFTLNNFFQNDSEVIAKLNKMPKDYLGYALHYYAHEKEKRNIFNLEIFKDSKTSIRLFSSLKKLNISIDNYLDHDRDFYFTNEMLRKIDRMCMAFSIESRIPFVSRKIRSFCRNSNFSDFFLNNNLKGILRLAFKDLLPEKVLKRKKHGFNFPIDFWLKNSKKWNDLLHHSFSEESALFKLNIIDKMSLVNLRKMLNQSKLNGHTFFCYIMLNKWLERSY